MQQTLLSLVALLIATFLSFSQQQADIRSQQQAMRAEMEMMALGVAMQTMEVVRARKFDAATHGSTKDEILSDNNLLANTSNFGKEYNKEDGKYVVKEDCKLYAEGSGSNCSFIEEYHGTTGTVPFLFGKNDNLSFSVEIEIRYVDDSFVPTGDTKKLQKEVIIYVQDDPSGDQSPRLPNRIRYSQVLTYP